MSKQPDPVADLFAACRALGLTPDGVMLGELGERIAAERYNLTRCPGSTKEHDAIDADGRRVEVKATGGKRGVAMRGPSERLIVLRFDEYGSAVEIYDGPGQLAWDNAGKLNPRNGQRTISLSKLRELRQ